MRVENSVFLESTALLKVLLNEPEAAEVLEILKKSNRVVACRLLQVEAERAVLRFIQDRPGLSKRLAWYRHELKQMFARIDFIEMTPALCSRAAAIAPGSRLRSLDALHLAAYEWAAENNPSIRMLTYDEHIKKEVP